MCASAATGCDKTDINAVTSLTVDEVTMSTIDAATKVLTVDALTKLTADTVMEWTVDAETKLTADAITKLTTVAMTKLSLSVQRSEGHKTASSQACCSTKWKMFAAASPVGESHQSHHD